jgi:hypothetical protein
MNKFWSVLFYVLAVSGARATDWGNTQPILDSLISKYESLPNYHTVFVDELIFHNGSVDTYRDTTIAFSSGDSSLLKTQSMVVLNTHQYSLRINYDTEEMYYQDMSAPGSKPAKGSELKVAGMMKMLEICDSLRLTSNASNNRAIEAYLEGSMVPKTKMIFDNNYLIKQIWRYYADDEEYQAQRIRFLVFEAFDSADAGVFDIGQYISLSTMTPVGQFSSYTLYISSE